MHSSQQHDWHKINLWKEGFVRKHYMTSHKARMAPIIFSTTTAYLNACKKPASLLDPIERKMGCLLQNSSPSTPTQTNRAFKWSLTRGEMFLWLWQMCEFGTYRVIHDAWASQYYALFCRTLGDVQKWRHLSGGGGGVGQMMTVDDRGEGGSKPNDDAM